MSDFKTPAPRTENKSKENTEPPASETPQSVQTPQEEAPPHQPKQQAPPQEEDKEEDVNPPADFRLKYSEPPWSETSPLPYVLQVLKGGVIIEQLSLDERPFYLVGRVPVCHIVMDHPSISRQHAVFQHAGTGRVYVRDLGSTHGTYIGKRRIRPHTFCVVRIGDCVRFGRSSRMFILEGPTEEKRREMEEALEVATAYAKLIIEEKKKEEMAKSLDTTRPSVSDCSWGIGDDADIEEELGRDSEQFVETDGVKQVTGQEVFSGNIADMKAFMRQMKSRKRGGWKEKRKHRKQERQKLTPEEQALMEDFEKEQQREKEREKDRSYLYTFDDGDDFYDRTLATAKRKLAQHESKSKPETLQSLTAKKAVLEGQKVLAEEELERMTADTGDKESGNHEEDELDSFMSGLSVAQIKEKQKKQRLLIKELDENIAKVTKLLEIVQPALDRVGKTKGNRGVAADVERLKLSYLERNRYKQEMKRKGRRTANAKATAAAISSLKREELAAKAKSLMVGGSNTTRVATVQLEESEKTSRQYYFEEEKEQPLPEQPKKRRKRKKPKKPVVQYDDETDNYVDWVPPSAEAQQL